MSARTLVILHAGFWSLAGLLAGYFLFPRYVELLRVYYLFVAEDSFSLVNTDMGGQFAMTVKHSLSWMAVPVLAWGTLWVTVRYKNRAWQVSAFYNALAIAFIGYGLAAALKVFRMGSTLDYRLPPEVKQTLGIEAVLLHNWGWVGAVLACVFYFIVIKKGNPASR